MCRNLCIYKSFLPPTISFFIYIIVITCKKILKDPLSSFNIYKKIEINFIHY
jgi:hypothetical protein